MGSQKRDSESRKELMFLIVMESRSLQEICLGITVGKYVVRDFGWIMGWKEGNRVCKEDYKFLSESTINRSSQISVEWIKWVDWKETINRSGEKTRSISLGLKILEFNL